MDARWKQIDDAVQAALELPAQERSSFLDGRFDGDESLRSEARALLAACARSTHFLETPALAREPAGAAPAERIGRYRVLDRIAAGGMGEVFLAEQTEPVRRRVALKVVKRGMDTDEILRRFERERQTLAELNHPNIARLLDGGATDDGRPYLAMEYVAGETITAYCRKRELELRARLDLFREVCTAVEHAHRKLVVHRDLKPGNILVTGEGRGARPMLLDFGIAKLLTPDAASALTLTQEGARAFTPQYASPEQIRGQSVGVATDVYSLGVVLYELLIDRLPYDLSRCSLGEIERVVCSSEPPKPSEAVADGSESQRGGLARRLRGDLDTIVLTALRSEPDRRYGSVELLSDDIRRFLAGLPIAARPDTLRYRAAKFVNRHRIGVGGAIAFALILLSSSVVAWSLYARAERERAYAQRAEQDAIERLRDSYLAQARDGRSSGVAGQRYQSLDALRKAAAIRPGIDVRNEAIASMALPDLRLRRSWKTDAAGWQIGFDRALQRYAFPARDGGVTIRRFDDNTEEMRIAVPSGAAASKVSFSPDGRLLAASFGGGAGVRIWEASSGKLVLHRTSDERTPAVSFAPDSRRVAIGWSNGAFEIVDVFDPDRVQALNLTGSALAVAWHPQAGRIAVTTTRDSRLRIMDLSSGAVPAALNHPADAHGCAWSPDGRYLAVSCEDHRIFLWNAERSELRAALEGHVSLPTRLEFNRSGTLLVSHGWDSATRIWDVASARPVLVTDGYAMMCSSDDRAIGFVSRLHDNSDVREFEWATGAELRLLHRDGPAPILPADSVCFSPNGRWVLSAGPDGVNIWDSAAGRFLAHLPLGLVRSTFFEPGGAAFYACSGEGLARWTLLFRDGTLEIGPPHPVWTEDELGVASATPDGRFAVAVRGPWTVKGEAVVFDLETHAVRARLARQRQMAEAAISPDGRWAATATFQSHDVCLWNAQTGEMLRSFPAQGGRVQFSPDGRWLVVGSTDYATFYDTTTWQSCLRLPGPSAGDYVPETCFTPDGRMAAITNANKRVRLVDMQRLRELATVELPRDLRANRVALSPDGAQLAVTNSTLDLLMLWDLRRIRAQLAAMGLDWEMPALEAQDTPAAPVLHMRVDMGALFELNGAR